ncbi:glutamyl-tRNA reductase [Megalodesulfovibrio paquesii]
MTLSIYLIGLNHKTAPVEVREKFALAGVCPPPPEDLPAVEPDPDAPPPPLFPVGRDLKEVVVLSTCNRVEVLAVGPGLQTVEAVLERWAGLKGASAEELRPYVYIHEHLEAVEHLFCVACSLDSMVLGEPQILGQLKEAYRKAVEQNATSVICNRLLHKAFSTAKRVRTETAIGGSAVSISYAAVELAKRIFGEMHDHRAMLIGAGEMAELAATHLLTSGINKIFVANRTLERAVHLAEQFRGEAVPFDLLFERLHEVDIIISSTGAPSTILSAKDLKPVLKKRRNRPMFFIDIAVPRDIDPDVNNLDNVYLYDIDDLKEVVEENLAQRQGEAVKARGIVAQEAVKFGIWLKSLDITPTIKDLLEQGRELGRRELAKTLKRIRANGHAPEEAEVEDALEMLVDSLVRKLYSQPITFLKRRAEEEDSARRYIDITRRMFNLDDETVPPDAHQDRRTPSESCGACNHVKPGD